jgi:hypothetical protein
MSAHESHFLRRNETLLGLALAVFVALAIWWIRSHESVDAPAANAAELEHGSTRTPAREAPERGAVDPSQARAALADRDAPPAPAAVVPEPATATNPAEKPDMRAVDKLAIRVVDDHEKPVMDAEVSIRGMRREGDSGSWYDYRGDDPSAKTDAQGRVELSHWRWVTIDGRTRALDVSVVHPDFVSFEDSSFEIGAGEHVIQLQRGATVVVSGWMASHPGLITDLKIELDRDARVPSDAWVRDAGGRLSTTQLAPGKHLISIEHESPELGLCFSEIAAFELGEHEWKELSLELHAAETLDGELDPSVPRPIVDGHVMLGIQRGGREAGEPSIHRRFETAIRADGTFSIEHLPRGHGQVFALCRGWVSKRTLADSALDAGIHFSGEVTPQREAEAIAEMGDRAFQLPRVDVPPATRPFVIAMERTATIEVTVKREDGSVLANSTVSVSPNIVLIGVGAQIAPWRIWYVSTNSAGMARIEDLPPTPTLWFRAQHADYQLSKPDRERPPSIDARSGETTRADIVLEPNSK